MAAGFRVRKVKSDQAIGDRLKKARIRKKISVAEVEEATKIRAKFILALESDSWEQIPSAVYGRGYLERYLQFLQLPSDEIMDQYDRERASYSRHCLDTKEIELAPKQRFFLPKFLLTPKLFVAIFVIGAIGAFFGMIGSQIKAFAAAPFIELASPKTTTGEETSLVVSTTSVEVAGRTAIGASIKVNDQVVPVDDQGNFTGKVSVQKGYNSIVIKASNGKKDTTENLSVVVK